MDQNDTQMVNTDQPEATTQKKKIKAIVGIVLAAAILIAAGLVYFFAYKKPYDEAVGKYNIAVEKYHAEIANYESAVEKYGAEVSSLAERNEELDRNIEVLNQLITAENVPIDELLIAEPQSVLMEARNYPKDSAPAAPDLSEKIKETDAAVANVPKMPKEVLAAADKISALTDDVMAAASEVLKLSEDVHAMGDYSGILEKVQTTESKYRSIIENFKGPETEILWFNVTDAIVLRLVVKISNPNDCTLKGVTTEWIAYDADGAIVGSFKGERPDIPANGCIYYVGGAGSANLSDKPASADFKILSEGLLTNRVAPQITVSDVTIDKGYFGMYTINALCETDSDIRSEDLSGQIIVKDADGQIIAANFWTPSNLPDTLSAGTKFKASENFFDLPSIPTSAEVCVYYKWQ